MPALRPLACLALLWVAGCAEVPGDDAQGGPDPSTTDGADGVHGTTPPSEPPAKGGFRSLEQGSLSSVGSQGFDGRVLRDQPAWEAFWAEHRSGHSDPGMPPAVNFSTEVAIAVVMAGQASGGYAIEVTDIAAQGDGLVVRYAATSPGEDCGTAAVMTRPFHLVAAKGPADVPVQFELEDERVREC